MLRVISFTIAVILASIVLGYGPVNVKELRVVTTHQTPHQARHHVAASAQVHALAELRPKSLWALLRDHVRDEHRARSTEMWDDDDYGDDDIAPDTGMPSDDDGNDLVVFDIEECLRSAAPPFAAAHPTEVSGAIKLDEGRIQPASGYAKLREKPPRLVRG